MLIQHVTPRQLLRAAAGAFVALSLVTGAMAANADGKSPTSALPLTGIATGNIVGSTAGAFSYYTFPYAGDGSQGIVSLTVSPVDPVVDTVVGVNIYQNGNLLGSGNAISAVQGNNLIPFTSTTPGPVLVQVYDYGAGTAASFQLALQGVNTATPAPVGSTTPAAPVTAPAPAPAPTSGDGSAAKPFELKTSATGTLAGSVAGNYVNYSVPYAGDGSTQTLTFSFAPNGPDNAPGIFINVYQNGSTLSTFQGNDNGSNPTGTVTIQFSSTTAGPVVIQIGNYNPSGAINYTLSH